MASSGATLLTLSLVFRPNLLAGVYWTEAIALGRRGGTLNLSGGFQSWPDVPTRMPVGLRAPWVGSPTPVGPGCDPPSGI